MTDREAALKHFKKADPHFHTATKAHHASLPEKLGGKRTRLALFDSLIGTVISQQLGVAAADTIYARVKAACVGSITPESILKARVPKLRATGLSGAKTKTLKEIAKAVK